MVNELSLLPLIFLTAREIVLIGPLIKYYANWKNLRINYTKISIPSRGSKEDSL